MRAEPGRAGEKAGRATPKSGRPRPKSGPVRAERGRFAESSVPFRPKSLGFGGSFVQNVAVVTIWGVGGAVLTGRYFRWD